MWVPTWGPSRVDVGADVHFRFVSEPAGGGASGALLGILMEEKTSNKSFNGMVEGHPALLRANYLFLIGLSLTTARRIGTARRKGVCSERKERSRAYQVWPAARYRKL